MLTFLHHLVVLKLLGIYALLVVCNVPNQKTPFMKHLLRKRFKTVTIHGFHGIFNRTCYPIPMNVANILHHSLRIDAQIRLITHHTIPLKKFSLWTIHGKNHIACCAKFLGFAITGFLFSPKFIPPRLFIQCVPG